MCRVAATREKRELIQFCFLTINYISTYISNKKKYANDVPVPESVLKIHFLKISLKK